MSQSGRFTFNQPVPGAGIQTITGNIGGPVPGDGAANVDIVGVGTITVTGTPLTNTLTISSTAVPATYDTDNGAAVPTVLGILNVVGGPNINTDALVANTVTVNLNDNVTIPGFILATGDITSGNGDIVASNGDIIATVGSIIAGNAVQGIGGGLFNDTVTITAGGMAATGPIILNSLGRGVVQTDAAHTLFADNGANGQILIGGGIAPAWNNITGGGGIVVGNAANHIALTCAGSVSQTFPTDAGIAVPVGGALRVSGTANIHTTGVGNVVSVFLNDSVHLTGNIDVDGAGTIGGNLLVNGGGTFGGVNPLGIDVYGDSTFENGLRIDGTLTLTGRPAGVLFSDAAGVVTSQDGNPALTNGQVIISGPVAPQWAALTAGAGIAITNPAPNNITISAIPVVHSSFFASMNTEANVSGNGTIFRLGAVTPSTIDYNVGGNYFPGNGAGTPASYTAPANGTYLFTYKVTPNIHATTGGQYMQWYLEINGFGSYAGVSLPTRNHCAGFFGFNQFISVPGSLVKQLTAGDIVTIAFVSQGGAQLDSVNDGLFSGCFLF